jgi:hypothetical protein
MSTEAQVHANRANAQLSTGPRTGDGKAASSQNAYRHGLRSANPIAPGEDPSVWQAFALEVLAELDPAGMAQRLLAERIALLQWKLLRIPAIEATQMAGTRHALRENAARRGQQVPLHPPAAMLVAIDLDAMIKLQTYEMRLQRALAQARREYQQLKRDAEAARKQKDAEQAAPPRKPPAPPADSRPDVAFSPSTDHANPHLGQQLRENWVHSADPPAPDSRDAAPTSTTAPPTQ